VERRLGCEICEFCFVSILFFFESSSAQFLSSRHLSSFCIPLNMSYYKPEDELLDLDDNDSEYISGIDAIVVAIDCSPKMHKVGALPDALDQSFLRSSLKAALEIMQRKVICSESDMVSVRLISL
jgi:hypothetical protein